MSIRESFVAQFGEDEAKALERAAEEHRSSVGPVDKGDDPFQWVIIMCIGFECISKSSYRTYHQILAPYEELKSWIRDNAHLTEYEGSWDELAKSAGLYKDFDIEGGLTEAGAEAALNVILDLGAR